MAHFALGLDYGTESVRALVVNCESGEEVAEATQVYPHGVITGGLPADFALQNPVDYLAGAVAVIRKILCTVNADDIVGIGVDFTACTMLPIRCDGTPLCQLESFKDNPHAKVKLWKHHAAQSQADRINKLAHQRGEKFLSYFSGIVSSEWMLSKCWETLEMAPAVYAGADYFIEAGDWMVFQMTDTFSRNACAAGYKGLWSEELGNPSTEFLTALDPGLADLNNKLIRHIVAAGHQAGVISESFAAQSGLRASTPVSAAIIDAHSGVPGMGVAKPGPLCMIMGTSTCHLLLAENLQLFNGFAGVVKDGILPDYYGYESGQAAVGDLFGWFAKEILAVPFEELTAKAQALRPGKSGLVALDWQNGNRSNLMNAGLSGMILGLTLASKPEEIYRALVEATAFGTKIIIETYRNNGVPIEEIVACGGLVQSDFIMQIYADITGLPIKIAASGQAVALGSAIFGAVAAGSEQGGFDSMTEGIAAMTQPSTHTFEPNVQTGKIYQQLFAVYQRCHDHFGIEATDLMHTLKNLR